MCLIIANLDGREIPEVYIRKAYGGNHDGFGIMYVKDGLLKIRRGMFNVTQIVEVIQSTSAQKLPYVAHFRFGTQGTKDTNNCHPFSISEAMRGVAMMHNGVFSDSRLTRYNGGKSDTQQMADWIRVAILGGNMKVSDLFSPRAQSLRDNFDSDLASYNKVVFMNGFGKINILNEELGYWVDGVWYSNTYSIGGTSTCRAEGHEAFSEPDVMHSPEKLKAIMEGTFRPTRTVTFASAKREEEIDDDLFARFMGKNYALDSDDDEPAPLERLVPRRTRTRSNEGKFFFDGEEWDLSSCMPGADDTSDDDDTQPIELGDDLTRALAEAFGDKTPDAEDVDEGDSTDWKADLERYRQHSSQRPISGTPEFQERLKDRETKLLAASTSGTLEKQEKKEFVTRTYGTGGSYTSSYVSPSSYVYNSKANDIVELLLKP